MRYLDKLEEAKVDQGKSYAEKIRARAKRAFDAAYEDAKTSGKGKAGKMMRSKSFRKTMVMAARARRKHGDPEQPLAKQVEVEKKLKAEAYIQLGDILAEGILGEARGNKKKRVAEKLRTSANNLYRSAEVGEASGEDPENVKKKSEKALKRMAKAHDIEGQS
jgi:hypothetical protein